MKKVYFFILLSLLLSTEGKTQAVADSLVTSLVLTEIQQSETQSLISLLLAPDGQMMPTEVEKITMRLSDFTEKLAEKRKHSDTQFIQHIYKQVFKEFLKEYQQYSLFTDVMRSGKYDCLSSAILFAYVLDIFDYQYTVYETSYHLYLIVHLKNRDILIEPTDAHYGLVVGKYNIQNRVTSYLADNQVAENALNWDIHNEVNLIQLAGLQYFNKAIVSYNSQAYWEAVAYLKNACFIYPSQRNQEMYEVAYQKMIENK